MSVMLLVHACHVLAVSGESPTQHGGASCFEVEIPAMSHFQAGQGLANDELVVYDKAATLPTHIIVYTTN